MNPCDDRSAPPSLRGSAASCRGAGPKTTLAFWRGSYSELWHEAFRAPASPPRRRPRPVTGQPACEQIAERRRCRRPSMLARVLIEAGRVEAQQQHLIQPRAVAHHLGGGVHRPGLDLRLAVEHEVAGSTGLPDIIALGVDEVIALLRPLVGAGLFVVLGPRHAGEGQRHTGRQRRLEKTPPRSPRRRVGRRAAAMMICPCPCHACGRVLP